MSDTRIKYKRFSTISLKFEGISKVIQPLDQNKAHDQDNLSMHLLKIFNDTI